MNPPWQDQKKKMRQHGCRSALLYVVYPEQHYITNLTAFNEKPRSVNLNRGATGGAGNLGEAIDDGARHII